MKRKLLITLLALAAVLCCTFGLTACNGFGGLGGNGEGKFKLSNVKKIKIDDDQYQVEMYLGNADEINGTQMIYYGSNYKSVIAEQEKLEEQLLNVSSEDELEKLLEKIVKLEEKLQAMKYECLTVYFNNQSPACVTSVEYDAAKCEADPNPTKQSKEINLSDTGALLYTDMSYFKMTASITYTDGSYKLVSVPSSAISATDNTVTTAQTITWQDNWGSYSPQFSFLREYSVKSSNADGKEIVNYNFKIEDGDTAENYSTLLTISGTGSIGNYKGVSEAMRRYGNSVKKIIMGKNTSCFTTTFVDNFYNLESVVVEDGTKTIGDCTFLSCKKMTSLTLPASVETFRPQSLSYCTALTDINYGGTKAQWKAIEKMIRDDVSDPEVSAWNYETKNCTVHCTDGDVDIEGNEI